MKWSPSITRAGVYHRAMLSGDKQHVLYRGVVTVVDETRMHGQRLTIGGVTIDKWPGLYLPVETPELPTIEELLANA